MAAAFFSLLSLPLLAASFRLLILLVAFRVSAFLSLCQAFVVLAR